MYAVSELSITGKICHEGEPQLNIGEAGEAAPHDDVTYRRQLSAMA